MNLFAICTAIAVSGFSIAGNAQQNKSESYEPSASKAYARGGDSYLWFSSDKYKADKKYVVIKFWNDKETPGDPEKAAMAFLKTNLAKKNIEVLEFQWKHEADLKEKLAPYGWTVSVKDDKHINIGTGNMSLNTTSGKALFVMEDGKALSLCSGKECEENVKVFFKLKSTD